MLKKSTIFAVLPEDHTKKEFMEKVSNGIDSDGPPVGPDGKRISYSYDPDAEYSLLIQNRNTQYVMYDQDQNNNNF